MMTFQKKCHVLLRLVSNGGEYTKNMASLIKPGMMFQAACLPYEGQGGLESTMSSYGIADLEGAPQKNVTYVLCRDGSIQDYWVRNRPIGWELIEDGDKWFYRVTQMNHKPKPLAVFYMGTTENVPEGRGKIGSVVHVARKVDEPQNAEISEQTDTDIEVVSKYNPELGYIAAHLRDPVQTAALAKFAKGKLSYAEMRGLCG